MSIRERVKAIQVEIGGPSDLVPSRAAELLMQLTAMLGNVNQEIREADHSYAIVLLRFLDADEAANRAKIRAETSLEFNRKREARDTKELVVELCRSMKYLLRSAEEEMRLSR